MLTTEQVDRLQTHVLGILQSVVLEEITYDGCVLVRDAEGNPAADPVTTHHLVELCLEIDSRIFQGVIEKACSWFVHRPSSVQDPFFLTTLLHAKGVGKKFRSELLQILWNAQRPSGFIDLYAGFLDGGSIFSTLWATRIIQLASDQNKLPSPALRALAAVRDHWADVHRTSFKGFYLELASNGRSPRDAFGRRVLQEILESQDSVGSWDANPLYTAYVLGNLSPLAGRRRTKVARQTDLGFRWLFELDREPKGVPGPIAALQVRKQTLSTSKLPFEPP